MLKEKLHTAQGWICRFKKTANSDINSAIQLCTHRYRSRTISAMQLNTLPETPAQAMPALETTEGEQEDMLACALQTKKIPFSSRLWRLLWNAGLASGTYICTINDCSVERVYTSTIDCMYICTPCSSLKYQTGVSVGGREADEGVAAGVLCIAALGRQL